MKNDFVVIADVELEDKPNCFAWLSKSKCNALNSKDCKNCRFYKHKNEVPNYKKYLPKNYQNEKGIGNEN